MATFPPLSPDDTGTPHTEGRVTWVWDGAKWNKQAPNVETSGVALTDPTAPAGAFNVSSNKIPDFVNLQSQFDANTWMVDSLGALDDAFDGDGKVIAGIPVSVDPPTEYEHGTLWFESDEDSLSLFLFYDPVGDGSGGWIPAAPPSTLEGRVSATEAALEQVESNLNITQLDVTGVKSDLADAISTLTSRLDSIEARLTTLETSE